MACSCSPDDRLRRVLMVRRLHPAVTMQSLLQTFGAFGSITGCKVFTHKSGRSAGCASVEFASHTAACGAFRELQGSQLNGKNIHLQWFDPTLAQSPGRQAGQNLDLAMSPGAEACILAGKSSFGNGLSVPCTPHDNSSGQLPHMNTSPFGLLASSPHNPYCNGVAVVAAAAAAAAHQHQLVQEHQRQQQAAVLLANCGHMQYAQQQQQQQQHRWPPSMYPRQQQQLHRQVSAPNSGLQVPQSPHPSTGGGNFDALTSPRPCMHANSDPGSMAAAVASQSAAMAVANAPLANQDSSNSLAALQQLAAMQQQQLQRQFTASAIQQLSGSSEHSDSPLSPVRSVLGQQQTQQNAFALAAALHSQQQAQLQQQQLSGQLPSPAPRQQQQQQQQQQQKAKLQLARSMPAALGASLGSSCDCISSKDKLHGSAFELHGSASILQQQQQQQQHLQDSQKDALGSAGLQQISPFALNQQAPESSTPAATSADGHHTQGSRSALAAPDLEPVDKDTVPMSCKGLQGNTGKTQHAKKQLFRDEHGIECGQHGLSLLQSVSHRGYVSETGVGTAAAAGMSEYGNTLQQGVPAMAAEDPTRTSCIDDTSVAGGDTPAASSTADCSMSYPLGSCWAGQDQALDTLTPDLLASLQQQQHMPQSDTCGSPLLRNSRSAAAALQQLQLLAGSMGARPQILAGLLPLHQQHDNQCSMPMAVVDGTGMVADAMGEWAMRPAHVRVRASDSQVLLGGNRNHCSDAAAARLRLSSPSLPGSYESPAHGTSSAADAASAAAAHAWQRAMLGSSSGGSSNVQQQQQARVSTSNFAAAAGLAAMPASEVFKHKHKQQLQLELPEYDLVSAPLTSAQLSGPLESFDQLITTQVMSDPHAVTLQSHLSVSEAMLSGTAAAGLHGNSELGNEYGNSSSDGGWADWSRSMAALLSPMHLPCMVARRFTDSYIATDHSALQMQREQQQLRQQHSRSVAGCMPTAPVGGMQAGRSNTGLLGDCFGGLSLVSKSQGFSAAAESLAFGAASLQQQEQPGSNLSFSAFGMTRRSSLCLDAHPQLQPSGVLASLEAAPSAVRPGAVHTCSSSSSSSGNHGSNSQLKRSLLNDGGGLYSSGSFTFMPPVLAQQQQQTRFGNAGGGDDTMITEPFQMPAFFRSGGSSVPSTQQQQSASRSGGGGSSASPNKVAPMPLPNVAGRTDQQQRTSKENCGIESDAVAAPCAAQRQLYHSFSMPARIDPLVEPGGSVGCARKVQQQLLNQQQSDEVPYSDVFKTLWGPQQDEGSTERAA